MNLSIITIAYYNLRGLKRTVESVMRQNYRDWELIVIDGGSTDGTKEWLEEKANEINSNDMNKRFTYIRIQRYLPSRTGCFLNCITVGFVVCSLVVPCSRHKKDTFQRRTM